MTAKAISTAVSIGLAQVAFPASATTVFAVTSDDLHVCNLLGDLVVKFATLYRDGMSPVEISGAIRKSGVSAATAQAVESLVFGIQTRDVKSMRSTAGGLCILERLQPVKAAE
jgi:hypothetical protein